MDKNFYNQATRIAVMAHVSSRDSSERIDAIAMTAIADGSREEANELFKKIKEKFMGASIRDWLALPTENSFDE